MTETSNAIQEKREERKLRLEGEYLSPYRWVALVCIGLMHAVLMGTINQPSVFSAQIVGEMGASVTLFAQICLVGFLTGAIFSVPMGILADKWGVTKAMGLGLCVTLVGAIIRIFCSTPGTIYLACFIMGFGLAGLNANSPKFLKSWFGFRRVSTAMGIYVGCAGIGVAGFQVLGGNFQDLRFAFTVDAVCVAVVVIIWFMLARMPKGVAADSERFTVAAAKECLTNKHLMITSLAMICFMTVQVTYMSQNAAGFQYLGLDAGTAASWAALGSLVGIPANFVWPTLADQIGRIKAVLIPVTIVGIIAFSLVWLLDVGPITLVMLVIGGFFGFVGCAFIKGCVGKIPSIKKENMGTAGGIQTFFQNLGAFVVTPFIIAPISGGNYVVLFLITSGVLLLGLLIAAFAMPEFGAKGKLAQENAEQLDS